MSDLRIEEVIQAAQRAPSGDNCQPFKFRWRAPILEVYHLRQHADHPLNMAHIGSRIALGSVCEHIDIAASVQGYRLHWDLFDEMNADMGKVAAGTFIEDGGVQPSKLFSCIFKRECHRGPYTSDELPQSFVESVKSLRQVGVEVSMRQPQDELAQAIAGLEPYMWRESAAVKETFKWVRWHWSEYQERGDGMYWEDLGARAWEYPVVRMMGAWPSVPHWLIRLGLGGAYVNALRRSINRSSGLVLLSASPSVPWNLESLGRIATRTWLMATECGLVMQPLSWASMTIYAGKYLEPHPILRDDVRGQMVKVEDVLRKEFGVSDDHCPAWLLRVGRKLTPGRISLRRPMEKAILK